MEYLIEGLDMKYIQFALGRLSPTRLPGWKGQSYHWFLASKELNRNIK